MTPTCGAAHPIYKKLFCCRLSPCRELPHTAPLRRGHWVTWQDVKSNANPQGFRFTPTVRASRVVQNPIRGRYRQVGRKSKGKCWYCGIDFLSAKLTRDHIVPRSKGGLNVPSNLVLACFPCNQEKGNKSLEIYRRHVQHTRQIDRVVFYGETTGRSGECKVNSRTPLRVIQSIEEAAAFARQ